LRIIAFFGESVKFLLKFGELPVSEPEFVALVGEFMSSRFKLVFEVGNAAK